jgi:hypothetical protein
MTVKFSSSDRFALIGKTGCGKTFATTLLATLLLPWQYPSKSKKPWQIWFVDTKGDPVDLRRLREWGFLPVTKAPADWPRVIYSVRPIDLNDELSVAKQVQQICWRASRRGNVLIIIDEYVSCVMSARSTGAGLKNVYQRGRGLRVGTIGGTQEPVGIPRQLASQATHLFLFNVTYLHDQTWCNELCPSFGEGPPDKHGFWYRWLDGPKSESKWTYYSDITELVASTGTKEKITA